ncbi:MAG: DUF58 domain-containing protein, partial [Chloroflexi bacterium]|nr:DUF58 domain-containing protein [Chloroflexota bacterium]
MTPTPRLLGLFLVSAALAAVPDVGRLLALAIALALIGAGVVDWRLNGLGDVTAIREIEPKLSLGEWNPVAILLSNRGAHAVRVLMRDVVPVGFDVEPRAAASGARLEVGLRGPAALSFRVRPSHRGDYAFGSAWLRVEGPLGLIRRQAELAGTAASVRVYPSLKQLRRYQLMVRRGLISDAGSNPIRRLGASSEFERLREYVPDDEFRRINWKATARRGKPMVNEYQAERGQNMVLMVDAGRLMGARADTPVTDEAEAVLASETPMGLTKLDYALNAAMLLAYVASLRGDRVALLAYTDSIRVFSPPRRGRPAFLEVVDGLYNLQPEPVEPDHAFAFQFLASRNLRRSLAVLFTDISDRESSQPLVAHMLRAARQHFVVCVTLHDPTVTRPALATASTTQGLYEKMVAQQLID